MKLVIDAGHGGHDSGATGNGLVEKNLTLQIARRVRDMLVSGYDVTIRMTRDSDVFVSLSERANIANAYGADFFISFHMNSGGGTGYEDYMYSGVSSSSSTAVKQRKMHEAITTVLTQYGLKDRGAKTANFAVLRETAMDALLTETAFIDTAFDASLLKNQQFIEDLCKAYVRGIVNIMGLSVKPNIPNPSTPPDPVPPKTIGIVNILGKNVNLRTGPATSYAVIRQLNAPESYVVYQYQNGWFNLGGSQWVYYDPSYIQYIKYQNSDGKPTGVATILGKNINLRTGPATSYAVIRQLNAPESYVVYQYQNGWFNLGGSQWIYYDSSYIAYRAY